MRVTSRACGLACISVAATVAIAAGVQTSPTRLELFPDHTRLRVGEQIRYSVFQYQGGALTWAENYTRTPWPKQRGSL